MKILGTFIVVMALGCAQFPLTQEQKTLSDCNRICGEGNACSYANADEPRAGSFKTKGGIAFGVHYTGVICTFQYKTENEDFNWSIGITEEIAIPEEVDE